jgi:hypothetical protein
LLSIRLQVQGSTFWVEGKEDIMVSISYFFQFIYTLIQNFGPGLTKLAVFPYFAFQMQSEDEKETLNLATFEPLNASPTVPAT